MVFAYLIKYFIVYFYITMPNKAKLSQFKFLKIIAAY